MKDAIVTVSIEPSTAQTLMDWGVLAYVDGIWTIDLDIWRTKKPKRYTAFSPWDVGDSRCGADPHKGLTEK